LGSAAPAPSVVHLLRAPSGHLPLGRLPSAQGAFRPPAAACLACHSFAEGIPAWTQAFTSSTRQILFPPQRVPARGLPADIRRKRVARLQENSRHISPLSYTSGSGRSLVRISAGVMLSPIEMSSINERLINFIFVKGDSALQRTRPESEEAEK